MWHRAGTSTQRSREQSEFLPRFDGSWLLDGRWRRRVGQRRPSESAGAIRRSSMPRRSQYSSSCRRRLAHQRPPRMNWMRPTASVETFVSPNAWRCPSAHRLANRPRAIVRRVHEGLGVPAAWSQSGVVRSNLALLSTGPLRIAPCSLRSLVVFCGKALQENAVALSRRNDQLD